jgi:hypothetical protein
MLQYAAIVASEASMLINEAASLALPFSRGVCLVSRRHPGDFLGVVAVAESASLSLCSMLVGRNLLPLALCQEAKLEYLHYTREFSEVSALFARLGGLAWWCGGVVRGGAQVRGCGALLSHSDSGTTLLRRMA